MNILFLESIIEKVNFISKTNSNKKKINGEVFTPLDIINEMLDVIPPEWWSNPDSKWLDPAVGFGNFPFVIIKRLMIGLEKVITDEKTRFLHILKNQIYVLDINPINIFTYLMLIDPDGELQKNNLLNFFRGDYLSKNFDYKMGSWGVKKFDWIIGNPPYNKNIDLEFVLKNDKISDRWLFIHPGSYILGKKPIKSNLYSNAIKVTENNIQYFKILENSSKRFGINAFYEIGIIFVDKTKKGLINIDDIDIHGDSIIYKSIKNKILKYCEKNNIWEAENRIVESRDKKYLYKPKKGWYVGISRMGNHAYCTDAYCLERSNPKKQVIVENNLTEYDLNWFFQTQQEAINFRNYIKTKSCRFSFSLYKTGNNSHRGELLSVPNFDFKEPITNEKFAKYLSLTKEESEWMLKWIPNHYEWEK